MLQSWIHTVTSVFRARLLARLWLTIVLIGIYSVAVVVLEEDIPGKKFGIQLQVHTVLGIFIGLLLGFRNNTAYDRWWEGRKLWGQLVNDSRNLVIKVRTLPNLSLDEVQHVGRLVVNFARALKEHLREGIRPKQLSLYRQVSAEPKHVPMHLAYLIREKIVQWRAADKIDGFQELVLDVHSRALMDICGACERIRKTPLSLSYLAYIRQIIFLYVFTLPWALVDAFDWWTIPAVVMVAYFMMGIELIAEDVGEPFGREIDDLRLDDICQGIEDSVTEIVTPERSAPGEREASLLKQGPGDKVTG
jgi:ion channel-forming bestrophin family protein